MPFSWFKPQFDIPSDETPSAESTPGVETEIMTETQTTNGTDTTFHAEDQTTTKLGPMLTSAIEHSIIEYVRATLDQSTRESIIEFTERVLTGVLEAEISDIIGPRFESMYEGVVAEATRKFLLRALAERQQAIMQNIRGQ